MQQTFIVDYGYGNIHSVTNAIQKLSGDINFEHNVLVSSNPEQLKKADRIILPGQGAFGSCLRGLKSIPDIKETLEDCILNKKKPFLGICVGMQLLATTGYEYGVHAGLNWIPGEVIKIPRKNEKGKNIKIPHMGWNRVQINETHNTEKDRSPLKHLLQREEYFYFVHSFMFQCKDMNDCMAVTSYGSTITAIVGHQNILGVQFHPEKSGHKGLELLKKFIEWTP